MITTEKSHIDRVKKQHQQSDELIQALLDWSHDELCEFKYYMGMNYASYITGNDEMGYSMLVETQYYWAWWRNQWAKRDAEFLANHADCSNQSILHDEYKFSNSYGLTTGRLGELMDKMGASVVGFALDEFHKNQLQHA